MGVSEDSHGETMICGEKKRGILAVCGINVEHDVEGWTHPIPQRES